jgi:hypothetical protein
MSTGAFEINGVRVYECPADGPALRTERDATDLIGVAREQHADILLVPAERFGSDFFKLKNGIAGAFTQKFVTYGVRIAIVGDISEYLRNSSPLRDFVYEANRGNHIWFLESRSEFEKRLEPAHNT